MMSMLIDGALIFAADALTEEQAHAIAVDA